MTRWDAIVVGSGAGGAVAAARLAEAGADVVVLEEGPRLEPGAVEEFSGRQMREQYRGGGLTGALGRPAIAYAEGRCVGGGTEVNAGLYHRPPRGLLETWRDGPVPELDPDAVEADCVEIERNLRISPRAGGPIAAARALADGADRCGWQWEDVPRWLDGPGGDRRGMSATYLRRAEAAGAVVVADTRVDRVAIEGGRVVGVSARGHGDTVWRADLVVAAAGAVQTPGLLARSGLRSGRSRSLAMHPMAKVVARFPDPVNDPLEVGTVQVREFAPALTFGSSASTPAMLGIGLLRSAVGASQVRRDWPRLASYYVAISPRSRGAVVTLPGGAEPVVVFRMGRRDRELLLQGLARLTHLLLAAGAQHVIPSADGAPAVTHEEDLTAIRVDDLDLMTVHLTSSVPLGGPLDGWGRVRGVRGLWVCDASMLPGPPGVNPQGTVMGLAGRTASAILEEAGR